MRRISFTLLIILLPLAAHAQHFATLDYLKSISGKKTVAGQHNREPNSKPSMWTDSIHAATGLYPGLWSGDFLFQADNIAARWTLTYEAQHQWEQGAIVQLMFHTCPPTSPEPCNWNGGVLSGLSEGQWASLITDGAVLNTNWKKRLDLIVPYLEYLKDNGVEVLFRPLHEMNQAAFWWGGRPGPDGTAKLYRITHDYLTIAKGLTNLIWVWDMQDIDQSWTQYNPGDGYWDMLAFDVYSSGYSQNWYDYAVSIAGDKPLAIGECAVLPTSAQLQVQPRYVFFMAWAELAFTSNSLAAITGLYNADNVVTLDAMPGWSNATSIVRDTLSTRPLAGELACSIYPNPFNGMTLLSFQLAAASDVELSVYDLLGRRVRMLADSRMEAGRHDVPFDAAGLPSGVYIYQLRANSAGESVSPALRSGRLIYIR
jgi:mannan endo-1,4-beta-mannosidase